MFTNYLWILFQCCCLLSYWVNAGSWQPTEVPVHWINDELCLLQEVEEVHHTEQEGYNRAGAEDGHDKEAFWEEMPADCTHQMVELGKITQEDTSW